MAPPAALLSLSLAAAAASHAAAATLGVRGMSFAEWPDATRTDPLVQVRNILQDDLSEIRTLLKEDDLGVLPEEVLLTPSALTHAPYPEEFRPKALMGSFEVLPSGRQTFEDLRAVTMGPEALHAVTAMPAMLPVSPATSGESALSLSAVMASEGRRAEAAGSQAAANQEVAVATAAQQSAASRTNEDPSSTESDKCGGEDQPACSPVNAVVTFNYAMDPMLGYALWGTLVAAIIFCCVVPWCLQSAKTTDNGHRAQDREEDPDELHEVWLQRPRGSV